ncbi:MAG: hypothetical protein FJ398_04680 [Verrucomicrobia bacterium]|nr:hypothetical protein [Verrucomicrobiota bacterium]
MPKRRNEQVFAGLLAGVLLWGGYCAYRAHTNLVTLRVRNMDVRWVISKLEWQTWERIVVNKNVHGSVTLNVRNVPLEEVLNIIGLQTSARWTALYPIYSTRRSARTFEKVVQGDLSPAGTGWLNLQKTPLWQLGGMTGFANLLRAENKLVSAQIQDKDLDFAVLALSRFSRAQVVAEDGTKGTINLKLEQVPFRMAVARVAKQVRRKWDEFYTIQPLQSVAVVRQEAPGGEDKATQAQPAPSIPAEFVCEPATKSPEQALEAFLATMSPEERQKTQEQIATLAQINSLPPAERQQRMQEMVSQAKQASQQDTMQRIQNRLKNGTVEQRVARDRRQLEKDRRGEKP